MKPILMIQAPSNCARCMLADEAGGFSGCTATLHANVGQVGLDDFGHLLTTATLVGNTKRHDGAGVPAGRIQQFAGASGIVGIRLVQSGIIRQ